ncbi:hypothetical protein ACOMHN_020206 [Nucella lapillus]
MYQQPQITDSQQTIHSEVATFKPTSAQRRLRHSQRNNAFRKIVSHKSYSGNVLLFESDDIVLEYSCDPMTDEECTYWFVKQEEKNMQNEECVRLE